MKWNVHSKIPGLFLLSQNFWAQPDKPEVETQQGIAMADAAASLQIPYYIFSTEEDIAKEMHGKL